MAKYILKRVLRAFVTLFIILSILFSLLRREGDGKAVVQQEGLGFGKGLVPGIHVGGDGLGGVHQGEILAVEGLGGGVGALKDKAVGTPRATSTTRSPPCPSRPTTARTTPSTAACPNYTS